MTAAGGNAVAQDRDLGRLFFTPQQRQDLDRRRASNAQAAAIVTVEDLVTVNGRVSRSSGKTTAWINGAPQDDLYRDRDPSRVTLQGAENAPSTPLRVGETLDRVKGETRSGLEGGTITIKRNAK